MEITSREEINCETSSLQIDAANSDLQNDNENQDNNITEDASFEENVKTLCNAKKKTLLIDSESEEDDVPLAVPLSATEEEDVQESITKKKRKKIAIVDSDEDGDSDLEYEAITPHNKSFSDDGMKSNEHSNCKEHTVSENSEGNIIVQTSKLAALCDPESSDEESNGQIDDVQSNLNEEVIEPKQYKTKLRKLSVVEENPKKMTGKKAAELRKEIKSESQRMVREMNIALPYHKPKAFTLKEFLARRPKLSSAVCLESRTPPSVAIKMSKEQLEIISTKLKEREKEVKKFYKSESESEDDVDKDYVPPGAEEKKTSQNNDYHTGDSTIISYSNQNEDKDEKLVTDAQESTHLENLSSDIPTSNEIEGKYQDLVSDIQELTHLKNSISEQHNNVEESSVSTKESTEQPLDASIIEMPKQLNKIISGHDSDNILDNSEIDKEQANEPDVEMIRSDGPFIISKDVEPNTMNYEFNLDDLEENSERDVLEELTSKKSAQKQASDIEYTDLDKEIENFGEKNLVEKTQQYDNSTTACKKLSKLELIKEQLANIKPKLSGGPDDVVDLETGVVKPSEVSRLMERFVHHNLKKQAHKNKVKLSIVSIDSGEIHKETVAMNVEDDDDLTAVEEKPGARLQKLRDELQNQMAQKRSELWQKRTIEDVSSKDDPYEGEKEHYEDVINEEEDEEAKMTESSGEESDNEEDDTECNDKETKQINKKMDFIHEEAEESEVEDNISNVVNKEKEGMESDMEDEEESIFEADLNEEESSDSAVINDKKDDQPTPKKTLKRILKGFTEDSDDEDYCITNKPADSNTKNIKVSNDNVSQDDDDFLPPHQPQNSQTPVKQLTQTKSAFDFLTPISYITGLQNLNTSASKPLRDSPGMLPFQTANEPSPLKEDNWHHSLQKKLFTEPENSQDSQMGEIAALCSGKFSGSPGVKNIHESSTINEEELLNICSGKFPSTLEAKENEAQFAAESGGKLPYVLELQNLSDENPSTQDLLNICSGAFTGMTQHKVDNMSEIRQENLSSEKPPSTQELLNICSGAFTGITQNNVDKVPQKPAEHYVFNTNKEIKSLGEDQDLIISQLVDEEEMEKFKRRFDSPFLSSTQKRIVEEFEEVMGNGGVIDSDDEDKTIEIKKKKNQKRLMFSDDEDSDDLDGREEEIIDLHDVDEESDENGISDVPVEDVCYDSEENEIELLEEKGVPRSSKLKPSDFFENEAELSESEWGSADEDEKDLDTMEFEQGDAEKFDEKKMKTDLEKIHMRRLLDDDTREVKLLQELLLEDGELHGTGRERQFRWKNIDSVDNESEEKKEEEEEDKVQLDDEESEEQWRKMRHEREMFLKEKQKKSFETDDNDLLSKSQLLQIGHKVIQRSQNSQSMPAVEKTNPNSSPLLMRSFNVLNKRGSFLSRSDQVLQRLAEYSKVSSSVAIGTAKNSRNFVFQTVSVEESSISITSVKKRKAQDGTPKLFKKLRLSNNLSPVVTEKKLNKPEGAKAKLF